MIYSLFLYRYQVQNTANAAPRRVYDTLAHIGSVALRRINRNIVISGAEEKQKKRKKRLFGGT